MKHVLITGMGRTGRTTLFKILNDIKTLQVEHERPGDIQAYIDICSNQAAGKQFIDNRKYQYRDDASIYVEVNGCLRRHVDFMTGKYQIFHIVRDPKAVIRSICSRKPGPVFKKLEIEGETIFEKACNHLSEDLKYLFEREFPVLMMELLFADYDYFKDRLIQGIGLTGRNASKTKWLKWTNNPQNTSKRTFPKYQEWTEKQREYFKKTCGGVMKMMGYEV